MRAKESKWGQGWSAWLARGTQLWKSCWRQLIHLAWETSGVTKVLSKKMSRQWPLPSERKPGRVASIPLASASHNTRANFMKPVLHALVIRNPFF
ncbi:hypothetical protein I79_014466 [Cricetulus griseus]|uniref:Uncharacterized protein n=1 Tax=Cricetulus griseus TaxID=10029 RepID=G3HU60_CRIGR|nr:hypothetical protein I79_014466 [Cricetulus griseus]